VLQHVTVCCSANGDVNKVYHRKVYHLNPCHSVRLSWPFNGISTYLNYHDANVWICSAVCYRVLKRVAEFCSAVQCSIVCMRVTVFQLCSASQCNSVCVAVCIPRQSVCVCVCV